MTAGYREAVCNGFTDYIQGGLLWKELSEPLIQKTSRQRSHTTSHKRAGHFVLLCLLLLSQPRGAASLPPHPVGWEGLHLWQMSQLFTYSKTSASYSKWRTKSTLSQLQHLFNCINTQKFIKDSYWTAISPSRGVPHTEGAGLNFGLPLTPKSEDKKLHRLMYKQSSLFTHSWIPLLQKVRLGTGFLMQSELGQGNRCTKQYEDSFTNACL